jgi:hypothetical protein
MKYLDFYIECSKTGYLPKEGLCACLDNTPLLKLFVPDNEHVGLLFWGAAGNKDQTWHDWTHRFYPLRQNIVLLIAAMSGELNKKKS